MTIDRRLREQMDACRPQGDDLRAPEMADLADQIARDAGVAEIYHRSRRWDAQVASAMSDVAVPAGLADRLLTRMSASSGDCAATVDGAVARTDAVLDAHSDPGADDRAASGPREAQRDTPGELTPSGVCPPSDRGGHSAMNRRTWFAAAAVVLLSCTLGYLYFNRPVDQPLTAGRVQELAVQWHASLAKLDERSWETDLENVEAEFPIPREVTGEPLAFYRLEGQSFGKPVAYDLTPDGETERAYLIVTPIADDVDTSELEDVYPPIEPSWTRGEHSGRSVAVWKSNATLYVLVVEGDRDRYHSFVDTSPPPVT